MVFLLGVILAFAVLSAIVAATQAVAISRLAPAGEWRGWLLGWWRFAEIDQRAGLSGEANAAIYKRAVIAGLVFLITGLILSGWAANQQNDTVRVSVTPITDWRVLPARLAEHFEIRRAAPMPGNTILES